MPGIYVDYWTNLIQMSRRAKTCFALAVAVLLIIGGLYCGVWIISSADMAFAECANAFSLFSHNPRCRTPYVAMLLAAVLLSTATVIIVRVWRSKQHSA